MTIVGHITGTGRSGSTLLSFLLNTNPQIATVGEATGPPDRPDIDPNLYECSSGEPIGTSAWWKAVGARMAERGVDFSPGHWDLRFTVDLPTPLQLVAERSLRSIALDDLRDRLLLEHTPLGDRLRTVAVRNAAFAASVVDLEGARVFVDASKDVRRPVLLDRLTDDDTRVIHLIRGPHGYVNSRGTHRQVPIGAAVREWKRSIGHGERLEEIFGPDRFLRVRYEDLVSDVLGQLNRIAAFLDVDGWAELPDHTAGEHHVIGNKMRLDGRREISLDEAWRRTLDADQIATISRRTERERAELGYR